MRRRGVLLFDHNQISLRQVAELLERIGYGPAISLAEKDPHSTSKLNRALLIKTGVAGFAAVNIMLFSLPSYFAGEVDAHTTLSPLFRWASLALSLPVLLYSASEYFKSALTGLRRRLINIDVPIALGMLVLFSRSAYEVVAGSGAGYFDSFAGLVFFLLLGRYFKQKTFHRLSFDRDFKSYFPAAVLRLTGAGEESTPIGKLSVGDRVLIRNQELIPADARLAKGNASIDYSFVTGESAPVEVANGEKLLAGGRQLGGAIVIEVTKQVSESYLTGLWSSAVFGAHERSQITNLANRVSKYFTAAVLALAAVAGAYWLTTDAGKAADAVTAVLIVACPCALALSSPFTLGTGLRLLANRGFFLKSDAALESLAQIDSIVFDKTGTLADSRKTDIKVVGDTLSARERQLLASLAHQSVHPLSRQIVAAMGESDVLAVSDFHEELGLGTSGVIDGHQVRLGRRGWVAPDIDNVEVPERGVLFSVDGKVAGTLQLQDSYREGLTETVEQLAGHYSLAVISGDTEREQERLSKIFNDDITFAFRQSPHEKLSFIERLIEKGRKVLMVGDGLNDAGALRAATVGVAVAEDEAAFAPASDAILEGTRLRNLPRILSFAHSCRAVIILSFAFSFIYNLIGLSFAVAGKLSPLLSAILMPTSSITVVAFAVLMTRWQARRAGLA